MEVFDAHDRCDVQSALTQFQLRAVEVERAYPGVAVARGVGFEEIWGLFLDSGFLYPEKVTRLEQVMPEIQRTKRALLQANGDLLSTVVVRYESMPEAHISALRAYQQTWMLQHLAALPFSARSLDASARVTLALTYYAELRKDVQWFKIFYRPNNAWPSRVFGGFATQLNSPESSDLRVFHYLVANTNSTSSKSSEQLHVRAANQADLPRIEEWFVSRARIVEVSANDLQVRQVRLESISQDFHRAGLVRQRELLIAERSERLTGFALLEVSSLGLNFSELTNAFTVHLIEPDFETCRVLVAEAKRRYAQLGRSQCIALVEGEDLTDYKANSFEHIKDYMCWTFHRHHVSALEEYFIRLFGARHRRNE
jgi:hypothetical protein